MAGFKRNTPIQYGWTGPKEVRPEQERADQVIREKKARRLFTVSPFVLLIGLVLFVMAVNVAFPLDPCSRAIHNQIAHFLANLF